METIAELKKICGKETSSSLAGFYRYTSYYITWVLIAFHLTANQVSVLGLLLGLCSACLFVTSNSLLFMVASILLFFSVMMDYCDGEVARYRKYKELPDELLRNHGGFFDSLNHVAIPLVFICMSFSFAHLSHPLLILGIGFFSAFFRLLDTSFYGWVKPVLKKMNVKSSLHKTSSYAKRTRKVYSALTVPFMLFAFSSLDLLFGIGITFYLWLFYALCGFVLFMLEYVDKTQTNEGKIYDGNSTKNNNRLSKPVHSSSFWQRWWDTLAFGPD